MVQTNEEYLSNDLTYVYQSEIGERKKYTAVNGLGLVSTANANLDGTGTIATIVRASVGLGTCVSNITLKGLVTTDRGVIRLFIEDGSGNKDIIAEIETPQRTNSGTQQAFALSLDIDYMLKASNYLKASTELGQTMPSTAEAVALSFP